MNKDDKGEKCAEKLKVCVKDKGKKINPTSKKVCCDCEEDYDDTAEKYPDEEMVEMEIERIEKNRAEILEIGEEGE